MRKNLISFPMTSMAAAVMFVGGCHWVAEDAIDAENPEFTVWCGDNPCAWTVEEGDVEPAPTWHRSSRGIAFNSDPARISQVVPVEDIECILITTLGALEGDARFFWGLDFEIDNPPDRDREIEIPFGDWETVHRESDVPEGTTDVRLILEKRGPGRAMLASAHFAADYYCSAN